jgi:hypothetical protein
MTMDDREAIVRVLAKERLARLFKVPVEAVGDEAEFGRELRHSVVSDFWANEFEVVDRDIRDVAEAKTLSMLSSRELVIHTVGQYCEHMVRCHRVNPQEVGRVLKSQLR